MVPEAFPLSSDPVTYQCIIISLRIQLVGEYRIEFHAGSIVCTLVAGVNFSVSMLLK